MNKLMTTLIAAAFATTTFTAFAQAPAKSDAPKATPATPAVPAKTDAAKAAPAKPATPATPSAKSDAPKATPAVPAAAAPKGKAAGDEKGMNAKAATKSATEKK